MPTHKNNIIGYHADKPICIDFSLPKGIPDFPVAIFLHGFKGFKDWGYFPHLHEVFEKEGIALITVNFSHNGVTPHHPTEFVDLEAFGQNTISIELSNVKAVMEWTVANAAQYGWDPAQIALIGHSRGGGDAIVYAASDVRVNKVIAWAPIADFGLAFRNSDIEFWKKEGRLLVPNARTNQQMPVNYSFWEDLQNNADELNVLHAAAKIEMPMMIIHGESDESVPKENAEKIYDQCLHAVLIEIPGGTHTFNAGHPWDEKARFPFQLQEVLVNTIEFIKD